ncbi:MAG: ATP-binding protein [Vulcanimicrobiota bacterium]
MGYGAGAAVADLVDNSIAAGCSRVDIRFQADGARSFVVIEDDGRGMSDSELSQAMRIGSKNPLEDRQSEDLGRFGMGLKTASLSQCQKFTVLSKPAGGAVSLRCWDLEHVQRSNAWQLLCEAPDLPEGVEEALAARDHGTVVIWQNCDVWGAREGVDLGRFNTAFYRMVEAVDHHLRLFFHRYLESSRCKISINGNRLKPWDPFMRWHPATTPTYREQIDVDCYLQGFVLPHKDRLKAAEYSQGGGRDGWTAHQGFYIYRNDRLLVAGSWLGLGDDRRWTKDESYRLARLSLDISNSSDAEWSIDIKKSNARPPERLRNKLTARAQVTRKDARRVFAHRGSYGPRAQTPLRSPIWGSTLRGDHHIYRINRHHPLVERALSSISDPSILESLLRMVEETVPVQKIWLDVAEAGELSPQPFQQADPHEVQTILQALYDSYTQHQGYSPQEACARLLETDPFQYYPELVQKLNPGGNSNGS